MCVCVWYCAVEFVRIEIDFGFISELSVTISLIGLSRVEFRGSGWE